MDHWLIKKMMVSKEIFSIGIYFANIGTYVGDAWEIKNH